MFSFLIVDSLSLQFDQSLAKLAEKNGDEFSAMIIFVQTVYLINRDEPPLQ